jgi:hypothetical protein
MGYVTNIGHLTSSRQIQTSGVKVIKLFFLRHPGKIRLSLHQGTPTNGEGSVQLTLDKLVQICRFSLQILFNFQQTKATF